MKNSNLNGNTNCKQPNLNIEISLTSEKVTVESPGVENINLQKQNLTKHENESSSDETKQRLHRNRGTTSSFDNLNHRQHLNHSQAQSGSRTKSQSNSNPVRTNIYKRKSIRLGTAIITNEDPKNAFIGVEKKIWLYIYRVQKHVTSNIIHDFIVGKPECENYTIDVKEIPGHPDGLKRFVVSAPFKFKDAMNKNDFWPNGVGIKRFNFNRNNDNQKDNFLYNTHPVIENLSK